MKNAIMKSKINQFFQVSDKVEPVLVFAFNRNKGNVLWTGSGV